MRKKRNRIKPVLCLLLCAALLPGCLQKSGVEAGSNAVKSAIEKESAGEPQTGQETAVSGPAERLTERAKKSLEEKGSHRSWRRTGRNIFRG